MEDHKPLSNNDSEINHDEHEIDDAAPEDWRSWFAQNGITLTIVFGLLVFLFVKFDGAGLLAIAKAALGLSFVVFIHEMGHLLVAKWCDVHVTSFSIGFGPTLPGCWFKMGETTYKLALIPIGGYVQMVGQIDGDEGSDGSEDDPRSYRNKSVPQRMAIISAGVIMNVILAVIVFIMVYMIAGKNRPAAVVASVDSRSPCFVYGVKTGSKVTRIGAYTDKPNFEELLVTVLASRHGEKIPFAYQSEPDAEPVLLHIEPMMDDDDGRPIIGMSPGNSTRLREKRLAAKYLKKPVLPDSPADVKTGPAFEFSDEIIGMSSVADPDKITPLPKDWRSPDEDQTDYFEFERRMQLLADKEVKIQVRRKDGDVAVITVPPGFHRTLGVQMFMGRITTIRKDSAADGKMHGPNAEKNLAGDEIFAIDVTDAKGITTRYRFAPPPDPSLEISKSAADVLNKKIANEVNLDPMKLPFELKQWAAQLWQATDEKPTDAQRTVTLFVKRHNSDSGKQYKGEKLDLLWDIDWRFQRTSLSDLSSPLAVPELGFAYQVRTSVARVTKNDKLKVNDVIKRIQFHYRDENDELQTTKWLDLKDDQWAFANAYLNYYQYTDKVIVEVERDGKSSEIKLTAAPDPKWPMTRRGLMLQPDQQLQKANDMLEAVGLGFRDTYRYMAQVFENIRGMVTGRIAVKNIGGPITIARAAYRIADYDFWEFMFFIGMISVNLAVINFLPIPVLDGGHFVFLLYEGIRGKPASENVRIGATYVGLALILALFCFVFYIDIRRALDL